VTLVSDDGGWFAPGAVLWSGDTALTVVAARPYRDRGMVVAFEGITDRTAAEALRGTVLAGDPADRPDLDDGTYWPDDLIGLEVVDVSGATLGSVAAIAYGPQDRLVVETPSGRLIEVPFVEGLVGDPEHGRITVDPPGGMFDDEDDS